MTSRVWANVWANMRPDEAAAWLVAHAVFAERVMQAREDYSEHEGGQRAALRVFLAEFDAAQQALGETLDESDV